MIFPGYLICARVLLNPDDGIFHDSENMIGFRGPYFCQACECAEGRQYRVFFTKIKTWQHQALVSRAIEPDAGMNMTRKSK